MSAPASPVTPVGEAAVTPRFPVLDTLRAVGALAVVTTHTTFQAGVYLGHGLWGTLMSRLDVGVALFFVLSGFLLSYPWLARAQRGRGSPHLRAYLWKRFLRIYPLYLVTVVVALTFIGENAGASVRDWVTTLLLGDVYVHTRLPFGLTQMWSLSVEVSFYAVLPLLMLLAVGRGRHLVVRRVLAVLGGMVALTAWWHLQGAGLAGRAGGGPALEWLPAYGTWFALGIAMALLHVQVQAGRALSGPGGRVARGVLLLGSLPGCCWALAAAVMLLASTPIAGPTVLAAPTPAQSLTKDLLYAAVAALIVLPGVFAPAGGRFAQVAGLPALRHLGVVSFGVFCLHLPVLSLVMSVTGFELFGGHALAIWLLTVLLSLVAAEVAYRVVEAPAMRLRRWGRWGSRGGADDSAKQPARDTSTA